MAGWEVLRLSEEGVSGVRLRVAARCRGHLGDLPGQGRAGIVRSSPAHGGAEGLGGGNLRTDFRVLPPVAVQRRRPGSAWRALATEGAEADGSMFAG